MAITYDAPSDTITVTGFTEGVPCTFNDIWLADQAGGWGQVSKQCSSTQFCFDCKLQIGDGVNATWFADSNKQITVLDNVARAGNWCTIKANASLRSGVLVDVTDKITKEGCTFISLETGNWQRLIYDGTAYLYSTFFTGTGTQWLQVSNLAAGSRVWNCVFTDNAYLVVHASRAIDVYNFQSHGVLLGIKQPGGSTFEKLHITGGAGASWAIGAEWHGFTITDATIQNFTTEFEIKYLQAHGYLVNVVPENWTFSWLADGIGHIADVYRQYTFNLHVVGISGNNIAGALVTLTDNTGAVVFSVNTGAGGTIAEQTVTRGYYAAATGNTLQDSSPHVLTISAPTYSTYTHRNITLDEPIDWRIALHRVADAQAGGFALPRRRRVTAIIPMTVTVRRPFNSIIPMEKQIRAPYNAIIPMERPVRRKFTESFTQTRPIINPEFIQLLRNNYTFFNEEQKREIRQVIEELNKLNGEP